MRMLKLFKAPLFTSIALVLAFTLSGCGWIQSLRREVEDDSPQARYQRYQAETNMAQGRKVMNRFRPSDPATVDDARTAIVQGTPVDYSGMRAKDIRTTTQSLARDNLKNENSLWVEDGQNNFFFSQNRQKVPGDLITVVIEDGLRRDMITAVKRLLPPEYRNQEVRIPGITKEPKREPASTPGADGATPPTPEAEPVDDLLTAEVLERYPNGNLRIRAIKRIPFRYQTRIVEVLAIVKNAEIDERDTVKSAKFFENKVELYQ